MQPRQRSALSLIAWVAERRVVIATPFRQLPLAAEAGPVVMCPPSAIPARLIKASQPPITPVVGSHGYSGSKTGLQALLELAYIFQLLGVPNATTVYLAERTVIPLTPTLVVPSGVRLTTLT